MTAAPTPHPTAWHFAARDDIGLSLLADKKTHRRFENFHPSGGGPGTCSPWQGKRQRGTKTGAFTLWGAGLPKKGRAVSAPRFAWARANGPIPDGHMIRQTCGTDGCVTPAHLQAVLPEGKLRIDMWQGTHPAARLTYGAKVAVA